MIEIALAIALGGSFFVGFWLGKASGYDDACRDFGKGGYP